MSKAVYPGPGRTTTPRNTCVRSSDGQPKRKYESLMEAREAMQRMQASAPGTPARAYPCPMCGKYHWGRMRDGELARKLAAQYLLDNENRRYV